MGQVDDHRLPAADPVLASSVARALREGVQDSVERRWSTQRGERVFDVVHTPERDATGRVVAVLGIARDVTERKAAVEALRTTADRLKEAQRIAHIGSWDLDLRSNQLHWSDEVFRIFETAPGPFRASYEAFLDAVHPDDRAAVDAAYRRSLETREPYGIDHRLLLPDGRIKVVHEQGETLFEGDRPIRSVGTVQDITSQKEAEQALLERESFIRKVIDSVDEGFIVVDQRLPHPLSQPLVLRIRRRPRRSRRGSALLPCALPSRSPLLGDW